MTSAVEVGVELWRGPCPIWITVEILFGEEKSNVSNPVFKVGQFIAQVHLTILFDVFFEFRIECLAGDWPDICEASTVGITVLFNKEVS